jgi:hypothetical protein
MEDGGSGAAGGGLPLEERRDREAVPVCADASHADAGPDPKGAWAEGTACADASHAGAGPGRSKSRGDHQPWASPITSRTAAGRAKDRRGGGRRTWLAGLRHGET